MIAFDIDGYRSRSAAAGDFRITVTLNDAVECSWDYDVRVRVVIPGITGDGYWYTCAVNSEILCLVGETSVSLYVISKLGIYRSIGLHGRQNVDEDYLRQRFIAIPDGILFVYEGGVIRLTEAGEELWRIDHDHPDWYMDRIDKRHIWYSHEDDGVWRYSLDNGKRVNQS